MHLWLRRCCCSGHRAGFRRPQFVRAKNTKQITSRKLKSKRVFAFSVRQRNGSLPAVNKSPISVCIISGAEARRIGRTLESVAGWTSEIIVVLNEDVRDGTEEIALKHGAKVFREPWKGFPAQKNSANAKATAEWLLGLDADEVVSPALRDEIIATIASEAQTPRHAGFDFPRLSYYCGRWIRHGDWYPDRNLRLWRCGQGAWEGESLHEKLVVKGNVGKLRHDLLHYSFENINHHIAKTASYADNFAKNFAAQKREVSAFDLMVRPGWRFFRAYFLKLGFLDGWQGYYIAWMTAFYTATRFAKVREAQVSAQTAVPPASQASSVTTP
jgi:glycosyltransferase involved in cell wall biosynthesis